jgi:hypothetical protein
MLSLSSLSPSQKSFVSKVCEGIQTAGADEAAVAIYGDGSESPNGEKFAAFRLGLSFQVCFDFNEGQTYWTAVQLPVNL